jgi:RimJ/RimL family protein N-acetyltransferase
MNIKIESSRLLVRNFLASDLQETLAHKAEPTFSKYIGEKPTTFEVKEQLTQDVQNWCAEVNEKLRLVIELKSENKMVGILMFKFVDTDKQMGEIGFSLTASYMGQGFASEATKLLINFAFTEFNLQKIIALCDIRNTASYGLMERLGMKKMNKQITDTDTTGKRDDFQYELLRSDWISVR